MTTPETRSAAPAPTSEDVYQRAAQAYHGVEQYGANGRAYAAGTATNVHFRAAVDAAREDLAAEVARVTAERDQALARIAELEAEQQGGELPELKRAALKPGDILIAEVPARITLDQAQAIRGRLKHYFPDNEIAIVSEGVNLQVIEPTADTTGDQQ